MSLTVKFTHIEDGIYSTSDDADYQQPAQERSPCRFIPVGFDYDYEAAVVVGPTTVAVG